MIVASSAKNLQAQALDIEYELHLLAIHEHGIEKPLKENLSNVPSFFRCKVMETFGGILCCHALVFNSYKPFGSQEGSRNDPVPYNSSLS